MKKKLPLLWPSVETPAPEVSTIKDLHACLYGVSANLDSWESSLDLYIFSKTEHPGVSRRTLRKWGFIAANECVMQLYQLRERMRLIQKHKIDACPSIRGFIDFSGIRATTRRLDKSFPGIEELRHAIAHAAEHDTLPKKHAEDGEFALFGLSPTDRFSAPHNGQLYELKLTHETLETLTEIVRSFLNAFDGAAVALSEQGHMD